jgi:hypothetical protein
LRIRRTRLSSSENLRKRRQQSYLSCREGANTFDGTARCGSGAVQPWEIMVVAAIIWVQEICDGRLPTQVLIFAPQVSPQGGQTPKCRGHSLTVGFLDPDIFRPERSSTTANRSTKKADREVQLQIHEVTRPSLLFSCPHDTQLL